jgi:hypothetical protein
MEHWVDANGVREAEGEGHGRRLRDDRKGADLLFSQLARCPVGTNVVGTDVYAISYMEWRWGHAPLISELGHGVLGVLHSVAQEPVDFVEVDGEVFRA